MAYLRNARHRPVPISLRASRSPAAWLTLFIVLAVALAADLTTKAWSFRYAADTPVVLDRDMLLADPDYDPAGFQPGKPLLPGGVLNVRLVLNPGAVFGVAAERRGFFIAFTLAAVVGALLFFGHFVDRRHWLAHVSIGLALAGGLGNLYDRITYGRVRDFLQLLPGRSLPNGWTWPGTNNPEMFPWVFNIADVVLLVGMVGLMVHVNRVERGRGRGATERRSDEATEGPEEEAIEGMSE